MKKVICFIALAFFLLGFAWFYCGLYFPDPQSLASGSAPPVLVGLRLLFPMAAGVVLALGVLVWCRKLSALYLSLLFGGVAFAALLGYPVASEFYYHRVLNRDLSQFNTMLQLHPPIADEQNREPGELLIACLGGSTTAWPDTSGKDWPTRVQEQLQEKFPTQPIRVNNFAKEWYTTQHTLAHYVANVRHLEPDIVVVMHAINDLLLNADFSTFSMGTFRNDYGHFLGPMRDIIRRKTLLNSLRSKLDDFWYHEPREVITPDSYPGLVPFRRILHALYDLSAAQGAQLFIMSQPNLYRDTLEEEELATLYMLHVEAVGAGVRWSYEAARDGMRAYNQMSESVAESLRTPFLNLEAEIPKTLEFFTDDVHYTDASYPLISSAVTSALVPLVEGVIEARALRE